MKFKLNVISLIMTGIVTGSVFSQQPPSETSTTKPDAQSELQTAVDAFNSGSWEDATKGFTKVLAQQPNHNQALFLLGRTHFESRQFDEAEEVLEQAIETQPNSAEEHYWFARVNAVQATNASIFTAAGYASDALEHFKKSVEVEPSYLPGHLGLFSFYLNAPSIAGGSEKKAAKTLERIKPLSLAQYQTLKLQLLRVQEKEQESAEYAATLLSELAKTDSQPAFFAALEFQRQAKYDVAIATFKALAERYKQDQTDHFGLMALYQLGRTSVLANDFIAQGISAFQLYLQQIAEIAPKPPGPTPAISFSSLPEPHWAQLRLAQLLALTEQKAEAQKITRELSAAKIDSEPFQDALSQVKKAL